MKTIFCIDDTDNLASPRGTGELAAMLIEQIEKNGWGKGDIIVRHQLFFHPAVPYTSHNSAMSFTIEIVEENLLEKIIAFAGNFLAEKSAEGSDPGLCVAVVNRLQKTELLINFGKEAKRKVLTKKDAYNLANSLNIHLSEHGGTGQGVIGALAGVGLRLYGNDGRVRGKHLLDEINSIITVDDIYTKARIDLIKSIDGIIPKREEFIQLGQKVKSIYQEGKSILLVYPNEDRNSKAKWKTCSMEYIKSITS